jgi:hypothetical protein
MKHYNAGIVKGKIDRISEKSTDGGKPYLRLSIDCPGPYGKVKAFGSVFGNVRVEQFKKEFRKGSVVNLAGFLVQYQKGDTLKTSFNFIVGDHWEQSHDQHPYMRATFILVGEIMSIKDRGAEPEATVRVHDSRDNDQYSDLVVHIPDELLFDVEKGKVQRLTGHLKQDEDDCGGVIRMTRPLIETATTVGG